MANTHIVPEIPPRKTSQKNISEIHLRKTSQKYISEKIKGEEISKN
ncbi:MAG: hypothetical protein LBF22_13050 [Deltaproteobacteria bacterium]|jgi:hypothetical protein|nr:hypothetical protein [Deltaproteobacteria bacterium]